MPIVLSKRDKRVREEHGLDDIDGQTYESKVEASRGETIDVVKLEKRYKLTQKPNIIDTTRKRKY
jgi:hypothetical protein